MTSSPINSNVPPPRPVAAVAKRTQGQAGMSAQDFFQVLFRRKWAVMLTFVLFAIFTVGGTFLWWLYAPIYSASVDVKVSEPTKNPLGGYSAVDKSTMDRVILTYVQMFKSDYILRKAVEDDKIRGTYWHQKALAKDKDRIAEQLFKDLSVSPVTNTSLIRVSITDVLADKSRAGDLAEIVNTIAAMVVDSATANATEDVKRQISLLKAERDRIELDEKTARSKLEELELEAPRLKEDQRQASNELADLSKYILSKRADADMAKAIWDGMKDKEDPKYYADSIVVQRAIESDPAIQQLRIQLVRMNLELDRLKRKYGDGSRNVQDMEEQVKCFNDEIAKKEKTITELTVSQMREEAKMNAQVLQAQVQNAAVESERIKKSLSEIAAKFGKAEATRASLEAKAGNLDSINKRLLELDVILHSPPLTIDHLADAPREPLWPKWKVTIPVGLILGLVCGIAIALLLETSDKIVRTPADIAKRVNAPLLGVIPHASDINERIPDIRKAFLTHPDSLVCESFRRLATTVLFGRDPSEHSSLLVTSAMAEDGRSTVAMNLAACLAQAGKNVLVVDTNVRHPIGCKIFPECPEQGLTNVLAGEASWEELVVEVAPNLSMLPSGPMPTDAMEFFSAGQFKTLLAELTTRYDHVVFDGGPCMIVADAQALSAMVSGVVLVIRGGTTAYGLVQRMRETIKGLGGNVMGIVLNAARFTPGGYFRENYDAYYQYKGRGKRG